MSNITITSPLVDGSLMPFIDEDDSCKKAVLLICGDDLRPPPKSANITVKTNSGKNIEISIPNDGYSIARVKVDGVEI